jgi:hypothetical protein
MVVFKNMMWKLRRSYHHPYAIVVSPETSAFRINRTGVVCMATVALALVTVSFSAGYAAHGLLEKHVSLNGRKYPHNSHLRGHSLTSEQCNYALWRLSFTTLPPFPKLRMLTPSLPGMTCCQVRIPRNVLLELISDVDGLGFVVHPTLSPQPSAVSAFHQIHCLNLLWLLHHEQTICSSAGVQEKPSGSDLHHGHARYCIEYLRQSIMCAADSNFEPADAHLGGVTGWHSTRSCKDFAGLVSWATMWKSGHKESIV